MHSCRGVACRLGLLMCIFKSVNYMAGNVSGDVHRTREPFRWRLHLTLHSNPQLKKKLSCPLYPRNVASRSSCMAASNFRKGHSLFLVGIAMCRKSVIVASTHVKEPSQRTIRPEKLDGIAEFAAFKLEHIFLSNFCTKLLLFHSLQLKHCSQSWFAFVNENRLVWIEALFK